MSRRLFFRDIESDAPGFTAGEYRSRALADAIAGLGVAYYTDFEPPRKLLPEKGGSGDGLPIDANPPNTTPPFGGPYLEHLRGFLTHFITEPFSAAKKIPSGTWRIGCKAAHLSATSRAWLHFSIYAVDADGVIVGWAWDADFDFRQLWYDLANETITHVMGIPGARLNVPAGGRVVIEVWARQRVVFLSIGTQGVGFTFYMNGANESMGPVPGSGGLYDVASVASYVDFPGPVTSGMPLTAPDGDPLVAGDVGLFAVRMDPLIGMRHTRLWATDVIEHRDKSEQRVSLRQAPNAVATFRATGHDTREMQLLDAVLADLSSDPVLIPWWRDEQTLPVSLEETDDTAAVQTDGYQFVIGEKAIIWQDPFNYETVTIDDVEDGLLTFVDGLTRDWPAGTASIMPLKLATFLGAVPVSRLAQHVAEVDVTFGLTVVEAAA